MLCGIVSDMIAEGTFRFERQSEFSQNAEVRIA